MCNTCSAFPTHASAVYTQHEPSPHTSVSSNTSSSPCKVGAAHSRATPKGSHHTGIGGDTQESRSNLHVCSGHMATLIDSVRGAALHTARAAGASCVHRTRVGRTKELVRRT
jgi:hypothetical protein